MNGRTLAPWAFLALFLGSNLALADEKVQLRWSLKSGEIHRFQLSQTSVTRGADPDGKAFESTLGLTLDLTWTIGEVEPDGTAKVAQRIDRLRTDFRSPLGTVGFDSKTDLAKIQKAANSSVAMIFQALVGAEATFRISPTGTVSDISLSQKVKQTLANLSPDGSTTGGLFTEDGLKNMIARLGTELPGKPIEVGGQWSRAVMMGASPGSMALNSSARLANYDFTYKGMEPAQDAKVDRVEISARIDPPPADPNRPVVVKLQNLSAKGHYLFDREAGVLEESKIVEHVEMTARSGAKTLRQTVDTTTTLARDRGASGLRRQASGPGGSGMR